MFNRASAAHKLSLLVIILCSFIFGIGFIAIHEMKVLEQNSSSLYNDRAIPLQQLTNIRYAYVTGILLPAQQASHKEMTTAAALELINNAETEVSKNLASYKQTYLTKEEKRLLDIADTHMGRLKALIVSVKLALQGNEISSLDALVNIELRKQVDSLVTEINELVQLQIQVSYDLVHANESTYKVISKDFYIALGIALAFAIILSLLIVGDNQRLIQSLEASNLAIKTSEEKCRAFIKYAGDAVFILDANLAITEMNDSACLLTGYSNEALRQMSMPDLTPPEERANFTEKLNVIKEKKGSLHERRILRKDGSIVDTEVNVRQLSDGGFVSLFRDITERKKALEKQNLLASIIQFSEDAIISETMTGKITSWNRGAEKMYGYTPAEIIGKHISILLPLDRSTEEEEMLSKIKEDEPVEHYETKRVCKDGTLIDISLTISPIKDSLGNIIGASKIARDITEKLQLEKETRESREKYYSFFEQASDGIVVADLKGNVMEANSAICRLLGYTHDQMLRKQLEDLIDPEELINNPVAYTTANEGDHIIRERRLLRKDGTVVEVEVNVKKVGTANFLIIARDITERKKAQAEIIKLNRLYLFISKINESILKLETRNDIYQAACDIAVKYGKYKMAFMALYFKDEDRIEPFAITGEDKDYLKVIRSASENFKVTGKSPVGKAIQSRRFYYCNDISTDPFMLSVPWRDETLKRGFKSSIALPIIVNDVVTAVYTLYSAEQNAFNETEIHLLEGVTENIAYALDKIRLSELHTNAVVKLSESERKYRNLVEQASDPIFVINKETTRLLDINQSTSSLLGYDRDELMNIQIEELFFKDDLQKMPLEWRLVEQQNHLITERRLRKKDATAVFVELNTRVLENQEGFMTIARNITDRRKTEQYLKAILDNSPENIVLLDSEYKILIINEVMKSTLLGYFGKEIKIGDDYREFVVAPLIDIFIQSFEKAKNGENISLELETTNEQISFWFDYKMTPVYDRNGELLGVSLSAKDITERKVAEKVLLESEAKFRNLVEKAQVGVYIYQDDHFVYVNPALSKLFGYSMEELMQISFEQLIHDNDLSKFIRNDDGKTTEFFQKDESVVRAFNREGELLYIEIIASGFLFKDNPAVIGTIVDVTGRMEEEKRINSAIINAQENERIQIGMELHDNVKQILAASIMSVEIIKSNYSDKVFATELLNNLKGYINEAIDELRRLSHQLAPSVNTEDTLTEKIQKLVHSMNMNQDLHILMDIDEPAQMLSNDVQIAIYRIVQEQFANIIKYAHAAAVEISMKIYDEDILLTIKDNGKGFDTSLKKEGIGLENIKRRAQMLSGKATVTSAPGNGCLLEVEVPLK